MHKENTFIQRVKNNHYHTKNLLCIGLDPDLDKLPKYYPQSIDGINLFLTDIIQTTLPHCVCYKPNISFFEALGIPGLQLLEKIVSKIPNSHPIIIDAKRGDIGNTSKMQAKFIFDILGADATTLHPYMGVDSVVPFFEYQEKFNFILGLTSNIGANTFEKQPVQSGFLYEKVIKKASEWHQDYNNVGVVVGATNEEMSKVRDITPHLLFLIPGVGTQGGNYQDALKYGKNKNGLAIINTSRSVLYGNDEKVTSKTILKRITKLIKNE